LEKVMSSFSWSEEDLKAKVLVPYLVSSGFSLSEMEFEKSFKITVGTKKITVRSDILLKVQGHPMIVIEVKRPEHKINYDDANQAISYARLCETIAPFAMVTNLKETKLFDSYTRNELSTLPSLLGFSGKKIPFDEELISEALKTLLNLNYDFLQDFCQSQRNLHMMHLFGLEKSSLRFADNLYLNREGVQKDFKEFLQSKDKCFLLTGKQGTGKTFSMIKLAQSVGKRMPALFYDAAYIPRRLTESFEEDFCWGTKQRTWYGDIINQVDSILKKHNTQMVIFIDSINEVNPINAIKMDLIDLIRRLYNTSIKLCLACREEDWKFFFYDKGEPGIFASLMFSSISRGKTDIEGSILQASTRITDFSEHELDLVFPKYREVFDLRSGLSMQAKTICKHPETLRIVSELFSHSEIPLSLRRKKILDTYWLKKLDCTGSSQIAEQLLTKIGRLVLELKSLEVREKDLIELLPWSSIYQEVYMNAVSENLLTIRRDNVGDSYVRISPNLLLEYVLAKNLVEEYNKRPIEKKDIVSFATEISQKLRGFSLYEGSILLFCSIIDNPSELVLYLIKQFELKKIVDQIIDESPDRLENILNEESTRAKIRKALLFQEISVVRGVLITLLEKYSNVKTLAVELMLSKEIASEKRFGEFLSIIFAYHNFTEIFDLLSRELEEKPSRLFIFLYRAYLANGEIAKKILLKFKIGKLRHLVKSDTDLNRTRKIMFLIWKINKRTAVRIDPSQKLLADAREKIKNKTVKLPSKDVIFRKEIVTSIKKEALIEEIVNLLKSSPEGFTWKEVTDKVGKYKYVVLGILEQLFETGGVLREQIGDHFIYKIPPLADNSTKGLISNPPFAEYDSSIKEFARAIIESDFNSQKLNVDYLLEKMELGKYFSSFETCLEFSFEILSSSIDLARSENKNDLEIHGKTLFFWVSILKESDGIGKSVAYALINSMSKTAPKMFKNFILGIRGRQYHREATDPRITNHQQLQQKLGDFKQFFAPSGVRIPTEEQIYNECINSLRKLADSDGRIRNLKTIAFFKNVKQIFGESEKLSEIENRIEAVHH
jgi:hypothetical protein